MLTNLLGLLFLSIAQAKPKKTKEVCSQEFSGLREAAAPPSAELLAAREKVKTNFGWLPEIGWTDLTKYQLLSDVRIFEKGAVEKTKETAIGFNSFELDGDVLNLNLTEIQPKYRRKGLSELLLAEILNRFPQVKKIHVSDLDGLNYEELRANLDKLGCEGALRETFAYKRYARLGFTEMKNPVCRFATFTERDFGGKVYQIGDQPSEFSFTVSRASEGKPAPELAKAAATPNKAPTLPKSLESNRYASVLKRYWEDPAVNQLVVDFEEVEGKIRRKMQINNMSLAGVLTRKDKKTKLLIDNFQEDGAEWGEKSEKFGTDFARLLTALFKFGATEKAADPARKVTVVIEDVVNPSLADMLRKAGFRAEKDDPKHKLDQDYTFEF